MTCSTARGRDYGLRFGVIKSQALYGEAKKGTLPQRADALLFGRSPLDNLPKGRLFISSELGEQPHRIARKNVSMPSIYTLWHDFPYGVPPERRGGIRRSCLRWIENRKSAEKHLHDGAGHHEISPIHPNSWSDLRGRSEGYLAQASLPTPCGLGGGRHPLAMRTCAREREFWQVLPCVPAKGDRTCRPSMHSSPPDCPK